MLHNSNQKFCLLLSIAQIYFDKKYVKKGEKKLDMNVNEWCYLLLMTTSSHNSVSHDKELIMHCHKEFYISVIIKYFIMCGEVVTCLNFKMLDNSNQILCLFLWTTQIYFNNYAKKKRKKWLKCEPIMLVLMTPMTTSSPLTHTMAKPQNNGLGINEF